MHLHGDECVLASIPAIPSSMDPRAEATDEARFSNDSIVSSKMLRGKCAFQGEMRKISLMCSNSLEHPLKISVCRRVRKTAKSDYQLSNVRPRISMELGSHRIDLHQV
jgi:hypothetical protein